MNLLLHTLQRAERVIPELTGQDGLQFISGYTRQAGSAVERQPLVFYGLVYCDHCLGFCLHGVRVSVPKVCVEITAACLDHADVDLLQD